jgi:hypothetical protein
MTASDVADLRQSHPAIHIESFDTKEAESE